MYAHIFTVPQLQHSGGNATLTEMLIAASSSAPALPPCQIILPFAKQPLPAQSEAANASSWPTTRQPSPALSTPYYAATPITLNLLLGSHREKRLLLFSHRAETPPHHVTKSTALMNCHMWSVPVIFLEKRKIHRSLNMRLRTMLYYSTAHCLYG